MAKKQVKQKHVPIRTCIGCGRKGPKNDFIRFVRLDNKIEIDPTGKARGRGANVCAKEECFEAAISGKINKALKCDEVLTKEKIEILKKEFLRIIEEKEFRPTNKPIRLRITKKQLEETYGKDE